MMRIKKIKYPPRAHWPEITKRPTAEIAAIERKVLPILQDVQSNGDAALRKYSRQFDRFDLRQISATEDELAGAGDQISANLKAAIVLAKSNIENFHHPQLEAAAMNR